MRPEKSLPETAPTAAANRWRQCVEWAVVVLTLSGAAWLMASDIFASETEFGRQLPAWAARVLAIHGGIAMLALIAIGAWLPTHVVPRLRRRSGLVTGASQLGLLAVLAVTGFGLYYVADELSRPAWGTVHWVAGLVLAILLLFHRRMIHAARR